MAIDPAAGASMAGRPTICLRQSLSWFCFGSPTADAGPGRGAERARRTWHDTVMAAPTQIIVSPDWAATTDQHRQSESLGRGQHRSGLSHLVSAPSALASRGFTPTAADRSLRVRADRSLLSINFRRGPAAAVAKY